MRTLLSAFTATIFGVGLLSYVQPAYSISESASERPGYSMEDEEEDDVINPGYSMEDEEDMDVVEAGRPQSPDWPIRTGSGFVYGGDVTAYISVRGGTEDSYNAVRFVKFFNWAARHNGFIWYGEATDGSFSERHLGRYTRGNRLKDFVVTLWSQGGAPTPRISGDFDIAFNSVSPDGIPGEIVFTGAYNDTWIRIDHAQIDTGEARPPRNFCGKNFLEFKVYHRDDRTLSEQIGTQCLSRDHMTAFGFGVRNGQPYEEVSTHSNYRAEWKEVFNEGLRMLSANLCSEGTNCWRGEYVIRQACIETDTYSGPLLSIRKHKENWVPVTGRNKSSNQDDNIGGCYTMQ